MTNQDIKEIKSSIIKKIKKMKIKSVEEEEKIFDSLKKNYPRSLIEII